MTKEQLDELERLEKEATPGPWFQDDDTNIFSRPLSDKRKAAIRAHLYSPSADWTHPDDDLSLGGEPLGFVGSCPQAMESAAGNINAIVALRNAAHDLIQAARERDELVEFIREHGEAMLRMTQAADTARFGCPGVDAHNALRAMLERFGSNWRESGQR